MEALIDDLHEKVKTYETNLINITLWTNGAFSITDLYEMPPEMIMKVFKGVKDKVKVEMSRHML